MTGVNTYSTSAASNVNANTGINMDEGMAPGLLNNGVRAIQADIRAQANNPEWFRYGKGDLGYDALYVSGTSYKVAGIDVTLAYHVGRRTKVVGSGTGTIYGTITATAFSTDTTVTVVWDSGSLSNEVFTSVSLGPAIANYPVGNMRLPTRQVLTSGTTYTTPAGCRLLRVRMVGGGGGSSGSGTGSNGAGGAGGDTSFNSIVAKGGSGGGSSGNGGAGGTGGTGGSSPTTFRTPGAPGGSGVGTTTTAAQAGGVGGSSPLGGGGLSDAAAVANTGGGGGGNSLSALASGLSGSGGGAAEYVEYILSAPGSTYTYAVGAAGSAGAAGTSGGVGHAGGSGIIIVDEFY